MSRTQFLNLIPRYIVNFVMSAILASTCLGCANAQAPQDKEELEATTKVGLDSAKSQNSQWQIGIPIATYWGGPAITDATAMQMVDGGFNLVWCQTEAEMEIAKRYGLRVFLLNSELLIPEALDYPDLRADLDAYIERVKGNSALYGYFLIDEPGASAFRDWGKLVAYLREKDPKHLAYINLLPTYATNEGLETEGDLVERYKEYLRQYVETVKPELFSYDHYTFSVGSDGVQYFLNLELMRQASLETGIPFLNVVQASRWAEDIRVPNANEMRWLNYTSLAYGAQGLSYFLYYNEQLYQQFKPNAGQMMLPDGTPTPLYHAAKDLNPQFVTIASELQPLKSLGAYHVGKVYDGAKPLPEKSPFYLDFTSKNQMPKDGMLLGSFGKPNNLTHVLVVNLDYHNPVTTTVVGPKLLSVFETTTRTWKSTTDSRVTLTLPPGGGKLVRVQGSGVREFSSNENVGIRNGNENVTDSKTNQEETPKGYSWRLMPDNAALEFDVADAIGEAGTYIATFQWKRGDHALKIKSVALYAGEEKISEDAHVGEAGITNLKNIYMFELPKAAIKAKSYTLRAQVEGIGGTNSFGIVTVSKFNPREISKNYTWKLAPDVTTLQFDVANIIVEAGTYVATIQWKAGNNALKIKSVALYEGDKKVAEDVHEGWTGFENRNNSYTLKLPTYRTGKKRYTLRAQVEGADGTDSSGILTLEKIK